MSKEKRKGVTRKPSARAETADAVSATEHTPQRHDGGEKHDLRSPGYLLLSSVLGALSILSLNDELKLVKITKHITRWVHDYSWLVGKVRDVLFGWIDWRWVSVSRDEAHVLVLCALMAGAAFRAHRREPSLRMYKAHGKISTPSEMAVLVFLPALFAALIFPGRGGLWVALIWLLASVVNLAVNNDSDRPEYYPSAYAVRTELAGTFAILVVAVAFSRFFE